MRLIEFVQSQGYRSDIDTMEGMVEGAVNETSTPGGGASTMEAEKLTMTMEETEAAQFLGQTCDTHFRFTHSLPVHTLTSGSHTHHTGCDKATYFLARFFFQDVHDSRGRESLCRPEHQHDGSERDDAAQLREDVRGLDAQGCGTNH